MKTVSLLAIAALPLATAACTSLPSATQLADGTVAVYVSTIKEAPLPKPETQDLANEKCGGTAYYVATENVTPIKARHIYRCGAGGGSTSYGSTSYGASAGSTSTGSGNSAGIDTSYGSATDGDVTSSSLAPM